MTPENIALCLTVACPVCAQQPNEPCTNLLHKGTMPEPHGERLDSAEFVAGVNAGTGGHADELHPMTDDLIVGSGLLY